MGRHYVPAMQPALYRCLDKLLPHKRALFHQLTERWQDLFDVRFDILLYDLTSTLPTRPSTRTGTMTQLDRSLCLRERDDPGNGCCGGDARIG